MSSPRELELEATLGELDKAIAKLAEGTAPLDELVSAHERAVRLLAAARVSFAELKERADQTARLLTL